MKQGACKKADLMFAVEGPLSICVPVARCRLKLHSYYPANWLTLHSAYQLLRVCNSVK